MDGNTPPRLPLGEGSRKEENISKGLGARVGTVGEGTRTAPHTWAKLRRHRVYRPHACNTWPPGLCLSSLP